MSVNQNNWYDITIECKKCHDMYYCEGQLFSQREIELMKEILDNLFTRCHKCGAENQEISITVSNEYFTAEEIKKLRENKNR